MADFETRVRVSAKTDGFQKIPQEAAKLAASQKTLTQGFQTATKAATAFQTVVTKALKGFQFRQAKTDVTQLSDTIQDLEDHLASTAERQLELQRAIMQTEKGSEVYKHLATEMKALDDEAARVQKTITLVNRAFKDQARSAKEAADAARAARGAFTQGFAQGAGVGEYMQRGPGMWKQAAGRVAGRMGVGIPGGIAKGLATTPFSGVGGVMSALQSNVVTGLLSAPLQAGYGYAGQALEYKKQQLGESPFLQGIAGDRALAAARARGIAAGPDAAQESVRVGTARLVAKYDAKLDKGLATPDEMERVHIGGFGGGLSGGMTSTASFLKPGAEKAIRERMATAAEEKAREAVQQERKEALSAAVGAEHRRQFDPITKAGRELGGMTPQESLAFAGGVARVGGGGALALQQTGLLRAGVAAQTAFGVGPEVTGTMLGAARRGGVVGGAGGDQMAQMIGDAMKLGLEGSEIVDYMQTMAEGIEQWRNTGIPLNPGTIRDMTTVFAGGGLGVVQGQRVAKGFQSRAQQVGVGGPQNAVDMLLMQTLGGFQGGGIEEFQAARKKMTGGNFEAGEIQGMLQRLVQSTGKGAAGEAALQSVLNQMGITATPQLAEQLLAVGGGGPMGAEQQAAIEEFRQQAAAGGRDAPGSARGLEGIAARRVPGAVRQQAGLAAEQLGIGAKLLPSMLAFETATTKSAGAVGDFGKQLKALGDGATKLAEMFGMASDKLRVAAGLEKGPDVAATGG